MAIFSICTFYLHQRRFSLHDFSDFTILAILAGIWAAISAMLAAVLADFGVLQDTIDLLGVSDDDDDDVPSSGCASGGCSSTTGAAEPQACPVTLP